jgi:xanthine dehydrogenase accessory factor
VLQEAQKALADGEPRLAVLTPNLDAEVREGVELYRMTCYSGGTMEIYIGPYLPEPQLIICGASPAAEALVTIGRGPPKVPAIRRYGHERCGVGYGARGWDFESAR